MYIPKKFRIDDPEIIEKFISSNGFISSTNLYPIATHIPLDIQTKNTGEKVLWGHVSKGNPHWKEFSENSYVLAIFLSPIHSYISSSWYEKPNAPTWNYMSVHVRGRVSFLDGEKLWESVSKLTEKYEVESDHPVSLEKLPVNVQKMMNGLVGFEISVEEIDCAFKLSQNRNIDDKKNIIRELSLKDDELSIKMARTISETIK